MAPKYIVCKKYKQRLPALPRPPFPGAEGARLQETVSQQAWQDWLRHQTRLINEKNLNMLEAKDRQYLAEQREKFFSGEDYDTAEGYVAPSKNDE